MQKLQAIKNYIQNYENKDLGGTTGDNLLQLSALEWA